MYFYPRPPRGGRLPAPGLQDSCKHHFYPRPPRGGRPDRHPICHDSCEFLSTPSARRATIYNKGYRDGKEISIHALREEGDPTATTSLNSCKNFYPRPPRGGRQVAMFRLIVVIEFLSPPSARRATKQLWMTTGRLIFLSTPSARRATGYSKIVRNHARFLSTPSARRATRLRVMSRRGTWLFLSTPSARRATTLSVCVVLGRSISIHALREEGDW